MLLAPPPASQCLASTWFSSRGAAAPSRRAQYIAATPRGLGHLVLSVQTRTPVTRWPPGVCRQGHPSRSYVHSPPHRPVFLSHQPCRGRPPRQRGSRRHQMVAGFPPNMERKGRPARPRMVKIPRPGTVHRRVWQCFRRLLPGSLVRGHIASGAASPTVHIHNVERDVAHRHCLPTLGLPLGTEEDPLALR